MNSPSPFSFSRGEYDAVLQAVGRDDIAGHHFVEELERQGEAWRAMLTRSGQNGIPPELRDELAVFARSAAEVSTRLYALPQEVQSLLALHLTSQTTTHRLLADISAVIDPLSELAGIVDQVLAGRGDGDYLAGSDPDMVLLGAAATAYRNCFNLRVELGARDRFEAAMRVYLKALARQGIGNTAALLTDLERAIELALAAQPS